MKTLKITARYVEIDPSDNQEIDVRVKVYDAEYRDLIRNCETKDIISAIGITELLDNMDIKAVIAYLNDLGESLNPNRNTRTIMKTAGSDRGDM